MGSTSVDLTGLPGIGQLTNAIRVGPSPQNSSQIWLQNAQALDTLDQNFQSVANVVTDLQEAASTPSSSTALYFNAGSGASFSPNFAQGTTQVYTLTGNGTIGASSGALAGQEVLVILVQDSTGGRQITSWDASYHFAGEFDLDPTPNTATVFRFIPNAAGSLIQSGPPVTRVAFP
jgi:hypothetical protein